RVRDTLPRAESQHLARNSRDCASLPATGVDPIPHGIDDELVSPWGRQVWHGILAGNGWGG
ncbi:MAG TPA: hypothetical protein VIY86_10110, partial [Pirellulaceae bacterium]